MTLRFLAGLRVSEVPVDDGGGWGARTLLTGEAVLPVQDCSFSILDDN